MSDVSALDSVLLIIENLISFMSEVISYFFNNLSNPTVVVLMVIVIFIAIRVVKNIIKLISSAFIIFIVVQLFTSGSMFKLLKL